MLSINIHNHHPHWQFLYKQSLNSYNYHNSHYRRIENNDNCYIYFVKDWMHLTCKKGACFWFGSNAESLYWIPTVFYHMTSHSTCETSAFCPSSVQVISSLSRVQPLWSFLFLLLASGPNVRRLLPVVCRVSGRRGAYTFPFPDPREF